MNSDIVRAEIESCGYKTSIKKGKGSYGIVYKVSGESGQVFAFKYEKNNSRHKSEGLSSLVEIDILSRLFHPNIIHRNKIITNLDCEINGIGYLLPLADKTIADAWRQHTLYTSQKLKIMQKMCSGLAFLHASGILHLDLKDNNVVLKNLEPMIIDFSLSVEIRNVRSGIKSSKRIMVPISTPVNNLFGDEHYNDKADVWAMGIIFLQLLSEREPFNNEITDNPKNSLKMIGEHVMQSLSDQRHMTSLFNRVDVPYRNLCMDLIYKMLAFDERQRLSAYDAEQHPLFDYVMKDNIVGVTKVPDINYDYSPNHRDFLKILITWVRDIYPNYDVEVLFLAVDLFNRTGSIFKNDPHKMLVLAATCVFMSPKLTLNRKEKLDSFIEKIKNLAPNVLENEIMHTEIVVVKYNKGILNVNNFYNVAKSSEELFLIFTEIIMAKDSRTYAVTNPLEFLNFSTRSNLSGMHKNIKVKELLE